MLRVPLTEAQQKSIEDFEYSQAARDSPVLRHLTESRAEFDPAIRRVREDYQVPFKIVAIGDIGVGKSQFLTTIHQERTKTTADMPKHRPTIGCEL